MKKVLVGVAVLLALISALPANAYVTNLLSGGSEIVKLGFHGDYTSGDLRIEVQSVEKIKGGVEVFARAWKDGKQLGFGKDGTTDIERFRIFNLPTIDISKTLAQTISIVGKENTLIIKGSIGHTTDTFFPNVDGRLSAFSGDTTWSGVHDRVSADDTNTTELFQAVAMSLVATSTGAYNIYRTIYTFDTSPLPDTDSISSATISFFDSTGTYNSFFNQDSDSIDVVQATPASDSSLVNADYSTLGTTVFGNVALSSWATSTYNNFALNANGINNISKTGFSDFGVRTHLDTTNVAPTLGRNEADIFFADQTGTSNDPKLVVVHTAAPPTITGSGTTNMLAKFTATSTLANSLLSDDGSNTTLTTGNLLLQASSMIDTSSSGVLAIGSTTASSLRLGRASGTITILAPTTLQNLTALIATTTSLFSTNLFSTNANFTNLIFSLATGTSATTTNFSATNGNVTALTAGSIKSTSVCASSASPAVCGSAIVGSVAMATGGSTLVVNTSTVTANSQILITEDSSLGTRLGITCNTTTGRVYSINARVTSTSFTIKSSANPATNKACLSYLIVN